MGLINWLKCFLWYHQGEKLGTGQVIVTSKQNKPARPIGGLWDVFKCQTCKQTYAERAN